MKLAVCVEARAVEPAEQLLRPVDEEDPCQSDAHDDEGDIGSSGRPSGTEHGAPTTASTEICVG